jgi:hypothetical protein
MLSPLQITLIIFQLLALIVLTRLVFFQSYEHNGMRCIHYSKRCKTFSMYAVIFLHIVIAINLYEMYKKVTSRSLHLVSIQSLVYTLELGALITLTAILQMGVNEELRHEGRGEDMGELCIHVSNHQFIALQVALVGLWTGLIWMMYTKVNKREISKEDLFRELFNVA